MTNFLLGVLLLFTSLSFASPPSYVNLKPQFQSFLTKAKDADFESQLKLWKSEVESILPDVYQALLSQSPNLSVEANRRGKAQQWFPFFFEHADQILAQFDTFDREAWPMVMRLAANYPDVDFSDVKVIAMPSLMMFNGQVRTMDGKTFAMFGMDFLQLVEVKPTLIEGAHLLNETSVLVTHEFTHSLHARLVSHSSSEVPADYLLGSLWEEGIAQVHSQMLVPGTDLTIVFMEKNLAAKCTKTQLVEWALLFLKDIDTTSEDEANANYRKWFTMNDWKSLGVPRAGYCLGYHTVMAGLKTHSFNSLIRMKQSDVSLLVRQILSDFATAK